MKRFKFSWFIACMALIGQSLGVLAQSNTKEKKPNIIFIYADDLRFDGIGINGNQHIITPMLDRIAEKSVRFNQANVVFSLCSPSRAALLTGRYGSANGVLELGSDLNDGEITIAQYLKKAGYHTGMSGKWHIGKEPKAVGFDFSVFFRSNGTYYGRTINDEGTVAKVEKHCDLYCAERSMDFIKEAAKNEAPFFLFHNTQLPHMNGELIWDARQETKKKYETSKMPVAANRMDDLSGKPEYLKSVRNLSQAKVYGYPDSLAIQKHTLDYYSVITEMDEYLGLLFQTIEDLGLKQNTYVFFMSDNGWMLGEHGFTSKVLPYQPSTKVPLFVIGPDLVPVDLDQMVVNIDIAPTILELAGVGLPDNFHGNSLLPLLKGESLDWRDAFVYEGLGTYGGALPNLTVINKDFRYIETYENRSLEKVIFREFYDQNKDPLEVNNLMDSAEIDEKVNAAQELINAHKTNILNQ
ncbi:sulfatase-like hydrolase/transferase [uncultured Cyclobacterium sp.]|uniref:sulfatase-like hydrolase/transferase n=1 Tax=uncultured Cyclobacterium sp. TaxID=453820 RepID=UPI0030EBDE5B|tara:strand:+ start:6309 stop:7709 length:1401 start_codon:yes stop_codon:yes gene_type:complete